MFKTLPRVIASVVVGVLIGAGSMLAGFNSAAQSDTLPRYTSNATLRHRVAVLKRQKVAQARVIGDLVAQIDEYEQQGAGRTVWQTTPCNFEDEANCYWNDDPGHDFYSVLVNTPNGHVKQCWLYWGNRYARTHNHCSGN